MFKKNLRLPIDEFKKKKFKTASSSFFHIKFSPSKLTFNRFGVIISAKSEPKSTRRHLLKRKILSIAKKLPNQKTDFLIIALSPVKKLEEKDINLEVTTLFKKIIP